MVKEKEGLTILLIGAEKLVNIAAKNMAEEALDVKTNTDSIEYRQYRKLKTAQLLIRDIINDWKN
jgi:hypothetical protein